MSKTGPVKIAMIRPRLVGQEDDRRAAAGKGDIEIVCAAEPDPAGKALRRANRFKHYSSDQDAIQHPGVEAVIPATPHSFHAAQIETRRCRRKHIFCEKPLGPDPERGRKRSLTPAPGTISCSAWA